MVFLTKEDIDIHELQWFFSTVTEAARGFFQITLSCKDHGKVVGSLSRALRILRIAAEALDPEYVRTTAEDLMHLMTLHVTCGRVEKALRPYLHAHKSGQPLAFSERLRIRETISLLLSGDVPSVIASRYTSRLRREERKHTAILGAHCVILVVPKARH